MVEKVQVVGDALRRDVAHLDLADLRQPCKLGPRRRVYSEAEPAKDALAL